jgi:hypothetical protein
LNIFDLISNAPKFWHEVLCLCWWVLHVYSSWLENIYPCNTYISVDEFVWERPWVKCSVLNELVQNPLVSIHYKFIPFCC